MSVRIEKYRLIVAIEDQRFAIIVDSNGPPRMTRLSERPDGVDYAAEKAILDRVLAEFQGAALRASEGTAIATSGERGRSRR